MELTCHLGPSHDDLGGVRRPRGPFWFHADSLGLATDHEKSAMRIIAPLLGAGARQASGVMGLLMALGLAFVVTMRVIG